LCPISDLLRLVVQPETLIALIDHGRRLFVATSKLQAFAERIIKNFNLAPASRVYSAPI
jgi:phosphoglycolate phosphatase-like HAD superfamily hydrolase